MIETACLISEGQIRGDSIENIMAIGRSMLGAEIMPHDHVIKTLQALSGEYPLMVITKGDLLDQTSKIERSGMRKYFSLVEVINDKTPDSYLSILNRHHLNPKNFLMVGNSLRSDVLPILQLGGIAAHIPADTTWDHEMVPGFDDSHARYFELSGMHQLPELIASLN
jgi:putative hydrolase of the HAD superfamily